jgi:metallophosphoesterase superfamily enzyme
LPVQAHARAFGHLEASLARILLGWVARKRTQSLGVAASPATNPNPRTVLRIRLAGEDALLHPSAPSTLSTWQALLVADAHFGKAVSFRKLGVPVPQGHDRRHPGASSMRRIAATGARQVVFPRRLPAFEALPCRRHAGRAARLARANPELALTLVRGNHDDRAGDPPASLGFTVVDEPLPLGPFALCHHPRRWPAPMCWPATGIPASAWRARLRALRLPCFWLGDDSGQLPGRRWASCRLSAASPACTGSSRVPATASSDRRRGGAGAAAAACAVTAGSDRSLQESSIGTGGRDAAMALQWRQEPTFRFLKEYRMKIKHAGWAVAAAAALAAPALFAQTAVVTSTGPVVTSSTGIVVTPGVPAMVTHNAPLPGAVMAQASQTTSVAGNTTTTTTRYWVNVPPDVQRDDNFRRWQHLK